MKLRRGSCVVALAWLLNTFWPGATLGAENEQFDLRIVSQPLGAALQELARQSGTQIIFFSQVTDGHQAPAFEGHVTLDYALQRLLEGSALTYQRINATTIQVRVAHPGTPAGAPHSTPPTEPVPTAAAKHGAQPAVAPGALPLPAAVPASQTEAPGLQEVLVTGSRVIANGTDSPTPLTVVQASELDRLRPTTLADALNSLPEFSGSNGQINVGNPTGAYGGGNNTANQLNMRNLGSIRDLILFDGQRVVPTLTLGTIDINMIPQLLIQRVEIVTGGVSAVYGSDAVSGVVNFITDKAFNGVKIDANAGVSAESDDRAERFGIAAGTSLFGGRAHIEGSYGYYDNQGIGRRSDRPYFPYAALGSVAGSPAAPGTTANPFAVYANVRNAQQSYGGVISGGALNGLTFDSNGVLTPFVHGVRTGTSNQEIDGEGIVNNIQLVGPLQYNQLFGRFDVDLTEKTRWHAEVSANWDNTSNTGITTSLNPFTFSAGNPFLAPADQAILAAANQATFNLRKTFPVDALPWPKLIAKEEEFEFSTGLEGRLGTYIWGVDVNYGASALHNTIANNPNLQDLAAALDVVSDAGGQPVCRALATHPGCVPLNAFGPNALSPQAVSYVLGATNFTPHWFMADGNAHVTGAPLTDWAGPVTVAVSAEWRALTYSSSTTPGANPSTFANCTGVLYNCIQGVTTLWSSVYAARSPVSNTVKEGAIEAEVPLLRDTAIARDLELNGAARYTSYATSGNYWTWKLGIEWHVTDRVTLRSTESRDIRAPTLYELFRPEVDVPITSTDLLTNTQQNVPSRDLAAPFDTAEIALTRTLGIVWRPAPQLSASLDAFRIRISNAIAQVQGFNNTVQQLCYASGGSSPYCALQMRPSGNFTDTSAANQPTGWLNYFENISSIDTYGTDLELNWSGRAFGHGMDARLLGTYQPHFLYAQPGQPTFDEADVAFPNIIGQTAAPSIRLTGMLTVGLTDRLATSWAYRWRNAMILDPVTTDVWVPGANHLGPYGYATLNLSYRVQQPWGSFELYGNVRNLFNQPAPTGTTANQPSTGFALSDDVIGRYYIVGTRATL
jgi:outer membrane receptor protein involved in Fe transport